MKIFYTKNTAYTTERGYTLLFAVLTATLVLSVGVFILSVSKKQYALSVTARESLYSIYAADGGMECAAREYYWGDGFATSSDGIDLRAATLNCNGTQYTANSSFRSVQSGDFDTELWSGNVYESGSINVPLSTNSPGGICSIIVVTYGTNARSSPLGDIVRIVSRGYNQCNVSGVPLPNIRTVERALRMTSKI